MVICNVNLYRRIILSYDQRGNDGSTVNDTMLVGLTSYQGIVMGEEFDESYNSNFLLYYSE